MQFQGHRVLAFGILPALFLAACGGAPTGQVVAVVNGEEISVQELNAEIEGANIPPSADKKQVRQAALQQLIDRRLLAQAAKEEGLDKDPAYITQQRRANEQLLVQMFGKRAADTIRVPDAAAIDKYIAENPTFFSQRTRYLVDQIQFPMPADPNQLKQLQDDHSLAAVTETLNALGIKYEQGRNVIDSGSVPPQVLKEILALPPGEPFVIPAGGRVLVSVITGSEPFVVPADKARPLAVQAIRNNSLNEIGQARLKEAKAKAKIEYQPGYAPPPPAKPAAAAK